MTIAPEVFAYVRRESAIVLETGKEYLVESRLTPLARQAGSRDVNAFVSALQARFDPAVTKQVVEALTTNETSWFRDGDPFTALRTTVLPDLVQRRAGRHLRIWSAACSSGQEPYSIAMTALDTPAVAGWNVEVLGTDLSEEMVARACAGTYSQLEVNRGLPSAMLVEHFVRDGGSWRIAPAVAAMVSFRPLNLVRPFPALGRFDVVFLRNVLIYFDLATRSDILRRVRQVLAPDGYLFLGVAEMTMGVDDAWERVAAGRSSVYRLGGERRAPAPAARGRTTP
jgi:chemotaxis protein methyltransferase CheR